MNEALYDKLRDRTSAAMFSVGEDPKLSQLRSTTHGLAIGLMTDISEHVRALQVWADNGDDITRLEDVRGGSELTHYVRLEDVLFLLGQRL